jgi:hypothetical protein
MTSPLQDAAGAGPERKDVARLDQVVRTLARVDRDLDRSRAVVCGDTGGDTLARLNRDRESSAERSLVVVGHLAEVELVAALFRQAEADQPARVRRHEIDRLGGGELRRDGQIALIFAVGRIDDHHELALADILQRRLDGGEGSLSGDLGHPGNRNAR